MIIDGSILSFEIVFELIISQCVQCMNSVAVERIARLIGRRAPPLRLSVRR